MLSLLGSFASSFVLSPWTIVLFVLGIIFFGIEMAMPGFGVFGFIGLGLFAAGSVFYFIAGGTFTIWIVMILVCILIMIAMFVLISKLISKGILSKTSIFNVKSSVPEDKTAGTKDFSYLLGQCGTTQTVLRPVGIAKFGEDVVDVVARDGFMPQNVQVVVVQVEGQRVVVVEKI